MSRRAALFCRRSIRIGFLKPGIFSPLRGSCIAWQLPGATDDARRNDLSCCKLCPHAVMRVAKIGKGREPNPGPERALPAHQSHIVRGDATIVIVVMPPPQSHDRARGGPARNRSYRSADTSASPTGRRGATAPGPQRFRPRCARRCSRAGLKCSCNAVTAAGMAS